MVLLLCCILSCEIKFQVPVVRRHFIQFDVKTMYNFYFLNSTRISATEKLFLPSSSSIYIILLAGFSFHFPQLSILSLQCNLCAWHMQVNVHTYVYDQSEGIMR